jgi:putative GTP pyrophosphokinase
VRPAVSHPSKSKINRAADRVREWWVNEPIELIDKDAELRQAAVLVVRYRLSFQTPLNKVAVGLRQFVAREANEIVVAQRLKRLPTIIGKLERHPGMQLARMQDIGGCRAILRDREEVEGVLRRITRNWDVKRVDDYATNPKPTGYRAVHAVVLRDERLIEIQLRTPSQQGWAAQVDRTGGRLGVMLKDGEGPPELVRYFERAAFAIALNEVGLVADDAFEREFAALREQVRSYFPSK